MCIRPSIVYRKFARMREEQKHAFSHAPVCMAGDAGNDPAQAGKGATELGSAALPIELVPINCQLPTSYS